MVTEPDSKLDVSQWDARTLGENAEGLKLNSSHGIQIVAFSVEKDVFSEVVNAQSMLYGNASLCGGRVVDTNQITMLSFHRYTNSLRSITYI